MASAFLDPIPISSKEYAFTDSGNVISRSAKIYGASNIVINGRSVIEKGCVIRGDLQRVVATPGVGGSAGTMSMQLASNTTSVNAGRYLSVGQGTVLRPPGKLYKGTFNYFQMKMGDFVTIGQNCIVEAVSIGNGSEIEDDCIIGEFVTIKDFVIIEQGTVLSPNTVCPNLTRWAGNPGRLVDSLPESTPETVEARVRANYKRYKVVKPESKPPSAAAATPRYPTSLSKNA
ncbi:hypothetical protein FFLO_04871 [Filobasidium floriforme]|uniref:Dynactin subunit 5 n=1 Tax=Filobasidium floriforme TaxID=5210 RepID=A0A8K0NRW6_9TREE|nr:trimeric LpxA-like protein [Filobasidium floriforme]KAG7530701.1 hypothetical protein FFLO_04871 [Filobasidium floriforme]KAH8077797.1 trimeric LpxA-like protein [Filobasidium floriforme]